MNLSDSVHGHIAAYVEDPSCDRPVVAVSPAIYRTFDEWITRSGWAEFQKNGPFGQGTGRISCSVRCYHNGNYVSATASADTSGEAFLLAIQGIEKTIGIDWRSQ